MILLEGQKLADQILNQLKKQIAAPLSLDIILVGNNSASKTYVNQKQKIGRKIGVGGKIHHLKSSVSFSQIKKLINQLNQDKKITGLMVQLPLPSHFNTPEILNLIDPRKDVDGLNALNLGLLFQNHPQAIPAATAAGILTLLQNYHLPLAGKHTVIINRSPVVGLPLAAVFKNHHATVTICHSLSQNLPLLCRQADILISAVNQPKFITPDFVKKGAVIIDVGYPQPDVNFNQVAPLCSHISPVPGGVGPLTIASLFQNLVKLSQITLKS